MHRSASSSLDICSTVLPLSSDRTWCYLLKIKYFIFLFDKFKIINHYTSVLGCVYAVVVGFNPARAWIFVLLFLCSTVSSRWNSCSWLNPIKGFITHDEKFQTECRGRVFSKPPSYSGGSGFHSWPGDRLSWLRVFVVLLSSYRQSWDSRLP
jgi:hypothetical protein